MMKAAPQERFFAYSIPEPNSGCWLWSKGVNACGYGVLGVNGRSTLAHRFSYELHYGEIPEGFYVLHRCDVPCCVNPDHLYLGTQFDNMRDMETRGRSKHPSGEDHGRAKLTESDVITIRASEQSWGSLSKQFGVSKHVVGLVKRNRIWKHV